MADIADIECRVCEIINDILKNQETKIVPEARFREDLGADSLDLVEIIMALEGELGRTMSDEDAQWITTVGEAIVYIYLNQYLRQMELT
jgi:acyl carrier protein